jgi:hypothetical protein
MLPSVLTESALPSYTKRMFEFLEAITLVGLMASVIGLVTLKTDRIFYPLYNGFIGLCRFFHLSNFNT